MKKFFFDKCSLHHVGIVVRDIHAALLTYQEMIGNSNVSSHFEYVPSQKVVICMVKVPDQTILEFIEPLGEDSPVYEFAKQGGGLHHLCYEVEDIEKAIKELAMKQIVKPVIGFEHRRIAFLFERTGSIGVSLIELAEIKY